MKHHLVLRMITKLLIPSIILFAFYVQFHGDYGPGGGFQAGVIFAAAFILHGLVFGLDDTQKVLPPDILKITAALGLLLYALTGLSSIFLGKEFLDYSALAAKNAAGQHLGILLVELGVGITVASIMLSFFYIFAEQALDNESESEPKSEPKSDSGRQRSAKNKSSNKRSRQRKGNHK